MGIGGALIAGAGIMSMAGQYSAGAMESASAKYNAAIADAQARISKTVGEIEAYRVRKEAKRFLGTQHALQAKSGIELSGSPLQVMIESAAEYELDAQITEYNAELDRIRYSSEATVYNQAAKWARISSYYGMGNTLLTTGSSLYTSGALTPSKPVGGTLAERRTLGRAAARAGYGSSFTSKYK